MPNRILRDWTASDTIDRLTHEQECTFTRLIMAVDDFGRFEADPRLLAARLYPLRIGKTSAQHMQSTCDALATHGIVKVYQVEGRKYLQIVKWQNVPRAKTSKFPAMPDTCTADAQQSHSTCNASAPVTVTGTETGTENRGPETESCGQAGNTALPPEASPVVIQFACSGTDALWPLTQDMIDGWVEAYPAVDVLAECRKAKAWEDSNPKNRKTFDGHARFLNAWMSKAQNQARTVPAQGQPAVTPEKPRGTWDLEKQIELLRSERERLYMSDFQNTGGPERNADRYAKWLDVSKKVRELQSQIAGKQ